MRRRYVAAAVAAAAAVSFTGGTVLSDTLQPGPDEVRYTIPLRADGTVNPDPFLASGAGIGENVATYTAAGTGPAARNTLAPAGTAERFVDYAVLGSLYPDFAPTDADKAAGLLPPGMTITEAQGVNAMARVQENLSAAGLTLSDLTFMRIYVDNPPGDARGDYAGWNRAYRRFVANVDLVTGQPIPAYAPLAYENATRPARSNIEVATLPQAGWLVEIETVAAYP